MDDIASQLASGEIVSIAFVPWESLGEVVGTLRANEIDCFAHGSRAYDIVVARSNVERAKQILEEVKEKGYTIHLAE